MTDPANLTTAIGRMSNQELTDYYSRCHKRALHYEMHGWYSLADAEHERMTGAREELISRGMRVRG